MVLFNGDRVCFRSPRSGRYGRLEFGRIQEFEEVEENPVSGELDELTRHYGDVISEKDGQSSKNCGSPMIQRSRSQPDLAKTLQVEEEKAVKKRVVWDNPEREDTEIAGPQDELLYKVIDRKFQVGQQVWRDGKMGVIVEVIPLATVCLFQDYYERVIPDVPLSEILPISPIFCGVTIEFNGWLGQVIDSTRRAVYRLPDSSTFTRTFTDSLALRKQQSRVTPEQLPSPYTYPWIAASEIPYAGKQQRLNKTLLARWQQEEESDKENNAALRYATRSKSSSAPFFPPITTEHRRRSSKLDREADFITAIVESVSILSLKIRWTGRLPAHLIKDAAEKATTEELRHHQAEMPSTFIRSPVDIKKVRPLYIHPALYFEKKGLCVYKTRSEKMIPERKWSFDLYRDNNVVDSVELVAPFNLSALSLSGRKDSPINKCSSNDNGKRKRCHDEQVVTNDEEEGERTRIVCKHLVRHKYVVSWDSLPDSGSPSSSSSSGSERNKRNSSAGMFSVCGATELQPVLQQQHKLCLGLIHSHLYLMPNSHNPEYGKCDFGIVHSKPDDSCVVVEWLKILESGAVRSLKTVQTPLYTVDKHPIFNNFHEGRIVVRAPHATTTNFSFGTVVKINRSRSALGQITVHCAESGELVELWPHCLRLWVGMSMEELISLKVVGQQRKQQHVNRNHDQDK